MIIIFCPLLPNRWNWDSIACILMYGLDDPGFDSRQGPDVMFFKNVRTDFGAHPISCSVDGGVFFPGDNAAGE
jgi:hypothetical protein